MADGKRATAVRIGQYLLALGALAWLAHEFDLRSAGRALLSLDPLVLAAIGGLTAAEFASRFGMWYALLRERWHTSFGTVARVDLVIKFINHVIPSKAAGHSVAPVVLRYYTSLSWTEAATIAGLNTGLYGFLYGTVAAAGLALIAGALPHALLVVLVPSIAVYLVAGTLILLTGRNLERTTGPIGRLESVIGRLPVVGDRIAGLLSAAPSFTTESASLFRAVTGRPSAVVPYAIAWSGTIVVVPGLRTILLLTAVGGTVAPLWVVPFALVVAYSVTILPITPGGVGITEVSATLVFVALGVPEETAVVVILLDRSLGVYLPALLGWLPAARVDLAGLLTDE
ncbi:lysylphosphatidylglycerol synthase transmembrane domain-containing protein [Halorientalis brevis]|uniref:Lysylphosphatidylglycerol synthase transmembrane domain-containing protein n=1 Tax=Halorientalis brevis TaxID=1126241 RepID=A0ABD6C9M7_9EURY|nr:lysylphosphatidylglycerol synthase transmembrane domain-containing protein [Halorientalis brevis]